MMWFCLLGVPSHSASETISQLNSETDLGGFEEPDLTKNKIRRTAVKFIISIVAIHSTITPPHFVYADRVSTVELIWRAGQCF